MKRLLVILLLGLSLHSVAQTYVYREVIITNKEGDELFRKKKLCSISFDNFNQTVKIVLPDTTFKMNVIGKHYSTTARCWRYTLVEDNMYIYKEFHNTTGTVLYIKPYFFIFTRLIQSKTSNIY